MSFILFKDLEINVNIMNQIFAVTIENDNLSIFLNGCISLSTYNLLTNTSILFPYNYRLQFCHRLSKDLIFVSVTKLRRRHGFSVFGIFIGRKDKKGKQQPLLRKSVFNPDMTF